MVPDTPILRGLESYCSPCNTTGSNHLLVAEPNGNFSGGGFGVGAAVDDVLLDGEGKVPSDGAGLGLGGVCGAHHEPGRLDGALALEDHGNNGTGGQISDQIPKKALAFMLLVMLLDERLWGFYELHGDKFQSARLKSSNYFAGQTAGDPIRFYKN